MPKSKRDIVFKEMKDDGDYGDSHICDTCNRIVKYNIPMWLIGCKEGADIICCTQCLKSLRSQINMPAAKGERGIILKQMDEEKGITEDSICDTCNRIVKYNMPMWGVGRRNKDNVIVCCNQCLKSFHSQIDPLRILAISGKDTK